MTRNLITVSVGNTVEDAVKKMIDCDVECLPVIDPKGYFTRFTDLQRHNYKGCLFTG